MIVPSQLLAKHNRISVGSLIQSSDCLHAKFTGIEGFAYLFQSIHSPPELADRFHQFPFAGSFRCDLPGQR